MSTVNFFIDEALIIWITDLRIPQAEDAKYLGLHLDGTWNPKETYAQATTTWTSNVLATRQ